MSADLEKTLEKHHSGYIVQERKGIRYVKFKTDDILTHEAVDEILDPNFHGMYVLDISDIVFNGYLTKKLSVFTALIAEQLIGESSRNVKFSLNTEQKQKMEMIVSREILGKYLYQSINDYLIQNAPKVDPSKETTTLYRP